MISVYLRISKRDTARSVVLNCDTADFFIACRGRNKTANISLPYRFRSVAFKPESADRLPSYIKVFYVIVAKLFAVQLFHAAQHARTVGIQVQSRGLMPVFTVTQRLSLFQRHRQIRRIFLIKQITGNSAVVGGR